MYQKINCFQQWLPDLCCIGYGLDPNACIEGYLKAIDDYALPGERYLGEIHLVDTDECIIEKIKTRYRDYYREVIQTG